MLSLNTKTYLGDEMSFQSPPFWCLMKIQGFATNMEFKHRQWSTKYKRAPPRGVRYIDSFI
jgi:hypothetical protein